MKETPAQVWSRLAAIKEPLMKRAENYSSLTVPKLMIPIGNNFESTGITHDYQSLGAQAVNHVTNKIMLALFAPTRPFFRISPTTAVKRSLAAQGVREEDIAPALGAVERAAVKEFDARGQRPKLYALIRHLVVIGNALLVEGKDSLRIMSLRYYCIKRDIEGKLHTLVIKEEVCFNELDPKVQAAMPSSYKDKKDGKVAVYKLIERTEDGKGYTLTQMVDSTELPEAFNGKYTEETLPYKPMVWDLADEHDYGTGLVEEYEGDFEAMSALSESVVDGAILGAEWRWLVNPTGYTSADDLNKSKNGDAINGTKDDINPTQGGNPESIKVALTVADKWEQRIARGFLLLSPVTRDAERVTAEEIRMTAQELETAFGGVYSSLAVQIQTPLAKWLLKMTKTNLKDTGFDVAIVTGLDALSRNGDLDNFRLAMADLAGFNNLPEQLIMRFDYNKVVAFVGNGRGIDLSALMKSQDEIEQDQANAIQAQAASTAANAAAENAAAPQ